jgi:hypothetical protein
VGDRRPSSRRTDPQRQSDGLNGQLTTSCASVSCQSRAARFAASPEAAAAAARQSAEVRQKKARVSKKRAIHVYRDAIEEHAQSFVDARLQIINDPTAPSGGLRAMEQLESRALGKPKETVEQVTEEPEFMQELGR